MTVSVAHTDRFKQVWLKLDAKVEEGSRIEIYRPITADPELVERRDRYEDDE